MNKITEVTVNKDTQTPAGTTRFNVKDGAAKRYYMTVEHQSGFLGQLRVNIQSKRSGSGVHHAKLQPSRKKKLRKQCLLLLTSSKDESILLQRSRAS